MKFKFNDIGIVLSSIGAIASSSFFNEGVMQELPFFSFLIIGVLFLIRGDILDIKDSKK